MTDPRWPTAPAPFPGGAPRSTAMGEVLVVVGSGFVVLGGLVAAASGPLRLDRGSWLAAYLVLVCGVGTRVIGVEQPRLPPSDRPTGRSWIQLAGWSIGNAAVIVGSLTSAPLIVDLGVPLLVVALVLALRDSTRGSRRGAMSRPTGWVHRAFLVILMIGAPVGAVLAHLRSGS